MRRATRRQRPAAREMTDFEFALVQSVRWFLPRFERVAMGVAATFLGGVLLRYFGYL
jgi:hypothetical protein